MCMGFLQSPFALYSDDTCQAHILAVGKVFVYILHNIMNIMTAKLIYGVTCSMWPVVIV